MSPCNNGSICQKAKPRQPANVASRATGAPYADRRAIDRDTNDAANGEGAKTGATRSTFNAGAGVADADNGAITDAATDTNGASRAAKVKASTAIRSASEGADVRASFGTDAGSVFDGSDADFAVD